MKPLVLLIAGVSFLCGKSITVETKIEPLAEIEQAGSFPDSGKSDFSLHRAQLSIELDRTIPVGELSGKMTLDPTEKEYDEMIHDGYVAVRFADPIAVQVGRDKVPFSRNASIGSSKLPTIYRSWTAEHLEDELGVSGFSDGITVSGTLFNKKLSYAAALYRSKHDERDGFSADRLVALPVFSLKSNPFEWLDLRWDMTLPLAAISTERGTTETVRPILNAVSVNGRAPKFYEGSVELFFGPDTAEGRTLVAIQKDYTQNISFSMLTLHELSVPIRDKFSLFSAIGLEYCNGLNRKNGVYVDRDFYWATTAVAGAKYGKLLRMQLSADDQFSDQFKSKNRLRLAAQLSLNGEITLREAEK